MNSSQHYNQTFVSLIVTLIALCLRAVPCHAQTTGSSGTSFGSAIADYFADWFPRVTRIQSEQPHWVTPVVTVTPRLEEEFRYDQSRQANQKGVATDNFGLGKGLELIPFSEYGNHFGGTQLGRPRRRDQTWQGRKN